MSAEIVAHMVGDYLLQSDWMARAKSTERWPAAAHAASYTACFIPITRNWRGLAVIGITHFAIDHWRLARYPVWVKNQLAPRRDRYSWSEAQPWGYHQDRHAWQAFWLYVFADNTIHLVCNRLALR